MSSLVGGGGGFITGALRAEAFDLLGASGGCDPLLHVDAATAEMLRDPLLLFPGAGGELRRFPGIAKADEQEYAKLVVRQLDAQTYAHSPQVRVSVRVSSWFHSDTLAGAGSGGG